METIIIENAGTEIVGTNYWQTKFAQESKFYVSLNAGAFRVLLPEYWPLREMKNAKYVIVSSATHPEFSAHKYALELLWEDGSSSPYCLHTVAQAIDCLPEKWNIGRTNLICSVWQPDRDGNPQKVDQWPARYRTAVKLPYLKPWGKK